jgi:membrane fusion protein, multidrug efflux system
MNSAKIGIHVTSTSSMGRSVEFLARAGAFAFLIGVTAFLAGCSRAQPAVVQAKMPEVTFVHPRVEMVRDYEDYTGRTEAIQTVMVRARVTGELTKILFVDGTEVEFNQPLFEIDPRPFEVELQMAIATVHKMDGDLKRKKILYERNKELRQKGTVSQEDLDNYLADYEVAKASLDLAIAQQENAKLNLSYCHIKAPFGGRIDRKMVDIGNQVTANVTMLTTIRNENPIYANFDVDERTELGLRLKHHKGELKPKQDYKPLVDIGLAHEDGYSLQGRVNYEANAIDEGTGTLRVRVALDNPDKHPRLLSHGMFVRARYWIGEPTPSIVVPEAALVSDQGIRHLYVLNAQNKVEYRSVETGLQYGDMRVILKNGVTPSDRVIVSGLQRVRPGIEVVAVPKKETKPEVKKSDEKKVAEKPTTTAAAGN